MTGQTSLFPHTRAIAAAAAVATVVYGWVCVIIVQLISFRA